MNLSVLVSAGQRPAPEVLADFRRQLVRWADQMPFSAWNLLSCLLATAIVCQMLFFGQAAAKSTAMDLAMPAGLASTRAGRRGTSGGSPDPSVPCGSYSRFSSDLQRDDSISDQQRKCHEKAATNGHTILSDFEFHDEAVSGTKRDRTGLNDLLAAAEAGKFKVLYLHSLSRLARESVISLPLLKHMVYNLGVRVISVTEGIDSDNTAWELIAHIMSIVHEQYVRDLAANVFRGQEGTVLSKLCVGDYCFGFTSVPIPGSEQGRRGRNAKPRKMYVIDPETVAWVARIFHWFVRERRTLRWIARELNRLAAPKDHRSTKPNWRHQYLPRLLRNRKYLGWWGWGKMTNVRNPLTGKIHQEERTGGIREVAAPLPAPTGHRQRDIRAGPAVACEERHGHRRHPRSQGVAERFPPRQRRPSSAAPALRRGAVRPLRQHDVRRRHPR